MFERLVSKYVTEYLAEYFEHGKLEVVSLGNVRVEDLVLKPSAVPANLPVVVRDCTIARMHVSVAFLSLLSLSPEYAITVKVEQIYMLLGERPEAQWDERTEFNSLKTAKIAAAAALREAAVAALETKLSELTGTLDDATGSAGDSAVMRVVKKTAARIANNIEVHIEGLNVAYYFEDGGGRSGELGFEVDNLRLENTSLDPVIEGTSRSMSNEPVIGGIVVEPMTGATEYIVRKQFRVEGVSVYLQENRIGSVSDRSALVEPFRVETVMVANMSAAPGPTVALAEIRVSQVAVVVTPKRLAALSFASKRLGRQVVWKAWCASQFEELVQTGLSAEEQQHLFSLYEEMITKNGISKDKRAQRPKPAATGQPPSVKATGIEMLLNDLSWLEKCEMRSNLATVEALLKGAGALVAQRERAKVVKQSKAQEPGIRVAAARMVSSWVGWAFGSSSTNAGAGTNGNDSDSDEEGLITAPVSDETIKAANDLTVALGIESDMSPKQQEKHFRKVFDAIDTDSSGDIDAAELQLGLALSGTTLSSKAISDLINRFDVNNCGTIDFDEFVALCKLAPTYVGRDAKTHKPVAAVSFTMQGISLLATGHVVSSSTNNNRVGREWAPALTVNVGNLFVSAALEHANNFTVGNKSFMASVIGVEAEVQADGIVTPLIGSKDTKYVQPLHVSPTSAIKQRNNSIVHKPLLSKPSKNGSMNVSLSQAHVQSRTDNDHTDLESLTAMEAQPFLETMVAVRVLRLELTVDEDEDQIDQKVYCTLFELDDSGEPVQHCAACLSDKPSRSRVESSSESHVIHAFATDLTPPLKFVGVHRVHEANTMVQVLLHRPKHAVLHEGKMFFKGDENATDGGKALIQFNSDDPLLGRAVFPIRFEAVSAMDTFSRLTTDTTSEYEEWLPLEGGFGKVLVKVIKTRMSNPRRANHSLLRSAESIVRNKIMQLVVATHTSVGYMDIAASLVVPRVYVELNQQSLDALAIITDGFSRGAGGDAVKNKFFATNENGTDLAWRVAEGKNEEVEWRCEKSVVHLKFPKVSGLPAKTSIKRCEVSCGSETIGIEPFQLGDEVALGETQNLMQQSSVWGAPLVIKFTLSDKSVLEAKGPSLDRVLSLDVDHVQDTTTQWCPLTEAGSSYFTEDEITTEETKKDAPRVMLSVKATRLELANPPSLLIALSSSAVGGGLNGPEAQAAAHDPEEFEWTKTEPADPFGLFFFPPVVERKLATLHIQVVRARGLRAADFGGTSDPYCVVKCLNSEQRTHVVNRNLNPVWVDECKKGTSTFAFGPFKGSAVAPNSPEQVQLIVKDYDVGGEWAHDLLGIAHLPIHDLYEELATIELGLGDRADSRDSYTTSGGPGFVSSRTATSKRYSQKRRSFKELSANSGRRITKWVPLHMQDCSSLPSSSFSPPSHPPKHEKDGAVELVFWFEPCADVRVPVPTLPVAVDLTMVTSISLPCIYVHSNYPANHSGRDMRFDLGKPSMLFKLNEGASMPMMAAVQGTGLLESGREENNADHNGATDSGNIHDTDEVERDFYSVAGNDNNDDDDDDDDFQSVTNDDDGDSIKDSMHQKRSQFIHQSSTDTIDTENFSVQRKSKRKTSKAAAKSTGPGAGPAADSRILSSKIMFHMDNLELMLSLFSLNHMGVTYPVAMLSVAGFEVRTRASVRPSTGLPELCLQLQFDGLDLFDMYESHRIIGRSLLVANDSKLNTATSCFTSNSAGRDGETKEEDNYRVQFRVVVNYCAPREQVVLSVPDALNTMCPALTFAIEVNKMFVLANPLLHFVEHLGCLFMETETAVAQDDPLTPPEQLVVPKTPVNPKMVVVEEEKEDHGTDSVKARATAPDIDAAPGLFLPVSKVCVNMQMNDIELHLLSRKNLGVLNGHLPRFPPRSLVVRSSVGVSYVVRACSKNDGNMLPEFEAAKFDSITSVLITHSRLDRHMFCEVPEGFFNENVIVEPFSIKFQFQTERVGQQCAVAARLGRKYESINDPYLKNGMNTTIDKMFRSFGSEVQDAGNKENSTTNSSKIRVSDRMTDRSKEAFAGVNNYDVDARNMLARELKIAIGAGKELLREFTLKVDGLEARLDSGDRAFLELVSLTLSKSISQAPPNNAERSSATSMYRRGSTISSIHSARSRDASATSSRNIQQVDGELDTVRSATFGVSSGFAPTAAVRQRTLEAGYAKHAQSLSVVPGSSYQLAVQEAYKFSEGEDRLGIEIDALKTAQPFPVVNSVSLRKCGPRIDSTESDVNSMFSITTTTRTEPTNYGLPGWLLPAYVPNLVLCATTAAYRRKMPGDADGAWTVERDTAALVVASMNATAAGETVTTFDEFRCFLKNLMVSLGNNMDGFPSPFLRLIISRINLWGCTRSFGSEDLHLSGYLLTTGSAFNNFSMAWEPLIEPWSVSITVDQNEPIHGPLVQIVAGKRLNVNFTDAFLKGAVDWSGSMDPGFIPLQDARIEGTYCPNWLVNETGHEVSIWPVSHPAKQTCNKDPLTLIYRGQVQEYRVGPSEVCKLHLHDTGRLRAKMSELLNDFRAHRQRLAKKVIKFMRRSVAKHSPAANPTVSPTVSPTESGGTDILKFTTAVAADTVTSTTDMASRDEPMHQVFSECDLPTEMHVMETKELLRKDLTELFLTLDEDGSGELSCVELQNALCRCGQPISLEEVLYSLGEIDEYGVENVDPVETSISLDEFLDFFLANPGTTNTSGLKVRSLAFRIDPPAGDDEVDNNNKNNVSGDVDGDGKSAQISSQILLAPSSHQGMFMLQAHPVDERSQYQGRPEQDTRIHASTSVMTKDVEQNEGDDESNDDAFNEEEAQEALRNASSRQRLTSYNLHDRKYSFPAYDIDHLYIPAKVKKMGRSSAADLLFLETPVRVENRTMVGLEVVMLCLDRATGERINHESIMTLLPGQERSIPIRFLYHQHFYPAFSRRGKIGFAVRPTYGEDGRQRLRRRVPDAAILSSSGNDSASTSNISAEPRALASKAFSSNRVTSAIANSARVANDNAKDQDSAVSPTKNNLAEATTPAKAENDNETSSVNMDNMWELSNMLVTLDGGQGLTLTSEPRSEDDLLDEQGMLLNDLLVSNVKEGEEASSGLISCSRVSVVRKEAHGQGRVSKMNAGSHSSSFDLVNNDLSTNTRDPDVFEYVMLTQRNMLQSYENVEVLTAQILDAEGIMAADFNGKSDPYVVVSCGSEKVRRTPVIHATLNPLWPNKATFRFGESKPLNHNAMLNFRLMDFDPIGSNDVLGYVKLSVSSIIKWVTARGGGQFKRRFPLVGGKGVSAGKVTGTLHLSLAYQKHTVRLSGPAMYAQHVLSFYSPFVLENMLPHEIEVKISHLNEVTGEVVRSDVFRIPQGAQMPFYELDAMELDYLNEARLAADRHARGLISEVGNVGIMAAGTGVSAASRVGQGLSPDRATSTGNGKYRRVVIQVRYSGHEQSRWSDPVTTPNSCVLLVDAIMEHILGSVSLEVVRQPSKDGGSRRCVIYAPFWVINKSNLVLDLLPFQPMLNNKRKTEFLHDWIEHREPGRSICCVHTDTEVGRILLRGRSFVSPSKEAFTMTKGDALFKTDEDLKSGVNRVVVLESKATNAVSAFSYRLIIQIEKLHLRAVPTSFEESATGCSGSITTSTSSSCTADQAAALARRENGVCVIARIIDETRLNDASRASRAVSRSSRLSLDSASVVSWPGGSGLVALDVLQEGNDLTEQIQSLKLRLEIAEVNVNGSRTLLAEGVEIPIALDQKHQHISFPDGSMLNFSVSLVDVPLQVCKLPSGVMPRSLRFELAVDMQALSGDKSMYTNVLTIQPRFLMASVCDMPLLVKQDGCPDETAVLLLGRSVAALDAMSRANFKTSDDAAATESSTNNNNINGSTSGTEVFNTEQDEIVPFHFSLPPATFDLNGKVLAEKKLIRVRLVLPGAPWSQPVEVGENADDFGLQLRDADGKRSMRTWVDSNKARASDFVVFRALAATSTTYAVQNLTQEYSFAVLQVPSVKVGFVANVKKAMTLNKKNWKARVAALGVAEDVLHPGMELALALDIHVDKGLRAHCLIVPISQTSDDFLESDSTADKENLERYEFDQAIRIRFKPGLREEIETADGQRLSLVVTSEGTRMVLRIVDEEQLMNAFANNPQLINKAGSGNTCTTDPLFAPVGSRKKISTPSRNKKFKTNRSRKLTSRQSCSTTGGARNNSSIAGSFAEKDKRTLNEALLPRRIRHILAERRQLRAMYETLTPLKPSIEVLISLSSFGVSLFSSKKQLEIAYFALQRIHIEYCTEPIKRGSVDILRTCVECSVDNMQIDSSQVNAKFPVMLGTRLPKPKGRMLRYVEEREPTPVLSSISERAKGHTKLLWDSTRRKRKERAGFHLQYVFDADPMGASSFDVYPIFQLRLSPIVVKIDGVFLAGLVLVLNPILQGDEKTGEIEGEGQVLGITAIAADPGMVTAVTKLVQPVAVPLQDTEYFDSVRIHPMLIVVTVDIGSDTELKQLLRQYGISPIYITIIKRVSRLEAWNLDLNEGRYNLLTKNKCSDRYSSSVYSDFIGQLHEVFLNRLARLAFIFRSKRDNHKKIREALVVDSDGVLQTYGPGGRSRVLEEANERRAALIIERFFYNRFNNQTREKFRQAKESGDLERLKNKNQTMKQPYVSTGCWGGQKTKRWWWRSTDG